jgi:hypothetical protein
LELVAGDFGEEDHDGVGLSLEELVVYVLVVLGLIVVGCSQLVALGFVFDTVVGELSVEIVE